MTWDLNIRKVDNGYVLSCEEQQRENYYVTKESVFELDEFEEEYSKKNRESVANMVRHIIDYFDEQGSKHDDYRLRVEVIKQK